MGHALTSLGRAKQHWEHLALSHAGPQSLNQKLPFHRTLFQIGLSQLIVGFCCPSQHIFPKLLSRQYAAVLASWVLYQFSQQQGSTTTFLPQLFQDAVQIAAQAVHLVDEQQCGNFQVFQGFPKQPGLGLNTFNRRKDQYGSIKSSETTLHFAQKVHVSRGVDQVELYSAALHGDRRGPHGDSSAAFHFQSVGVRGAVVHVACLTDASTQKKQSFGDRSFSRVSVGENPQVDAWCFQD